MFIAKPTKTTISLITSALMAMSLTFELKAQTENAEKKPSTFNCQKAAFQALDNLDSRNAILNILPLYAHDARQSLTDSKSAKNMARDLAWIGRALMYDENEIAAISVLSTAHRLAPDDLAITASLIDNLSRAGYPERVAALVSECADKQNLEIVKVKALIAMRETAPLTALKVLDTYAAKSKEACENPGFLVIWARCTLRNGLQKLAAERYRKAAKANRNRYVSLLWEAAALALEEKPGEAEQQKEKDSEGSQDLRGKRFKLIEEAGTANKNDPSWHTELASLYGNNEKSKALEQAEMAVRSQRFTSRSYYTMSSTLQGQQKFDLAEQYLKHVHSLRPRSFEALFAMARPLRRQKKFDAASELLRKGLELNPKAGNARIDLVNILLEQKKDNEAIKEIQLATRLCPEYSGAWRKMGDYNRKEKNWGDGLAAYENALSLYPKNHDDLSILSKHEIGQCHAGIGTIFYLTDDKTKALDQAKIFNAMKLVVHLNNGLELLHLRPDHIVLSQLKKEQEMQKHILLADMLFETKTFSESLTEYKQAEKINDDDMDLHSYILNVCVESGQWQDAVHEDLALSQVLVKSVPARIGDFFKKQTNP